jgi:hypothetical protein
MRPLILLLSLSAVFAQKDQRSLPADVRDALERRDSEIVRQAQILTDVAAPKFDRFSAALALGELRADHYAEDLAEFIALRDDAGAGLRQGVGLPWWFQYPVADALTKLGLSSFPAMQNILSTSDDAVERDQALRVVCGAYSTHLGVPVAKKLAEVMLQEWCTAEGDAQRRARLEHALLTLRRGDPWERPK